MAPSARIADSRTSHSSEDSGALEQKQTNHPLNMNTGFAWNWCNRCLTILENST